MTHEQILFAPFRTAKNRYVYDTYSNQILNTPVAEWESFRRAFSVDPRPRGSAEESASECPDAQLEASLKSAQACGHLQPVALETMEFCSEESTLLAAIRGHVPQLSLEVTEECNSRCHYCALACDEGRVRAHQAMEWTTARAAIDCFIANSREVPEKAISFWGGEPLLNVELIARIVDYMSTSHPSIRRRYNFTTNACRITPAIASLLAAADVQLLVSLDGPTHVHDRHRVTAGGAGTWDAAMRGLAILQQNDPDYYRRRVWFNCIIAPGAPVDEILTFFDTHELLRGHNVQFGQVSPFGNRFFETHGEYSGSELRHIRRLQIRAVLAPDDSTLRPLRQAAFRRLLAIARRTRTPISRSIPPNGCCIPLLKKMHVSVDGNIHLCERGGLSNSVGNVLSGGIDFQRVLALVRSYTKFSLPDCGQCWVVRLCPSCFRDFVRELRWEPADRQERCGRIRRATLRALEDYATVVEERPHALDEIVDSAMLDTYLSPLASTTPVRTQHESNNAQTERNEP